VTLCSLHFNHFVMGYDCFLVIEDPKPADRGSDVGYLHFILGWRIKPRLDHQVCGKRPQENEWRGHVCFLTLRWRARTTCCSKLAWLPANPALISILFICIRCFQVQQKVRQYTFVYPSMQLLRYLSEFYSNRIPSDKLFHSLTHPAITKLSRHAWDV